MTMMFLEQANVILHKQAEERVRYIAQELDKHLDILDGLRSQTEAEEAMVLALIHEQRLIEEKLQRQN